MFISDQYFSLSIQLPILWICHSYCQKRYIGHFCVYFCLYSIFYDASHYDFRIVFAICNPLYVSWSIVKCFTSLSAFMVQCVDRISPLIWNIHVKYMYMYIWMWLAFSDILTWARSESEWKILLKSSFWHGLSLQALLFSIRPRYTDII